MNRPFVSIVLPCLNERASVGLVVTECLAALSSAGLEGEVVVADNGSNDGSPEVAAAAGAVVVDAPVRGYGAALAAGFLAARGDICVMGDADATYPFERIGDLVAPVVRGAADMTVGSRWVGTDRRTMPFLHRFVGTPVITWLVRRAGGPGGLTDSQSGFRALRRQALLDLGLETTGMEYASEMLIVAGRAGWRIAEMPTGYRERIGESKLDTFRDGWRHLRTILLLAPHLAATLPGVALSAFGASAVAWALADAGTARIGSPAWLASFLGPAALILGIQGILVGFLLAASSPIRRDGGAEVARLIRSLVVGGAWALVSGLVLALTLVGSWVLGMPSPFRTPQIVLIALVLVLAGGSALGDAVVGRLVIEGSRRSRASASTARTAAAESEATAAS